MRGCWSKPVWTLLVSVRNAIGGTDLSQLHDAVKREFLTLNERKQNVRSVMAKMKAVLSAACGSFIMDNKSEIKNEGTIRLRSVRKSLRRPHANSRRVNPLRASVWPWHDGAYRLVGVVPTLLGAGTGIWLDQSPSRQPFLDADAAGHRSGDWLL